MADYRRSRDIFGDRIILSKKIAKSTKAFQPRLKKVYNK